MKAKQVITSVVAFALTLAVSATSIGLNSVDVKAAKASSMKVDSFDGTVTLKNSKGKAKTIKTGTRLLSGDNLATKTESTASILLDDTKAALVEESSQVSVKQSGKDLDLIVDKGSVFFDVSKKLTSKESFEIKTSNVVCGIRGTIGEVKVTVNKKKKTVKSNIYLLEGKVKVTYNKTKKKKASKTISAGQKLTLTTNTKTGKISASVGKLQSTDIKKAVAKKLQANDTLMNRVQTACPAIEWTSTIEDALAGKHDNSENLPTINDDAPIVIAENAIQYKGHYYYRFDEACTWKEAKNACEEKGGHLVTITSKEENDVVYMLVQAEKRHTYWLGGTDQGQEGDFKWITDEEFSFINWANYQPDNHLGKENYLQMYASSGEWNDASYNNSTTEMSYSIGYICEYES